MRIPLTNLTLRWPFEWDAPVWGWPQEMLVSLFDAAEDEGGRYLSMMYAAYVRECKVPAEFVCLVETKGDRINTYQFVDLREQDL